MGSLRRKTLLIAGLDVVMSGCGAATARTVPVLLQAPSNPLRPTFRWTPVDGAVAYQIQIDGSCTAAADCAFATPDVDQETPATSFVPAADLPASTSPPVGHRTFWRVRGCYASGSCADWSRVAIMDVGRQRQDFNGDGYADLAVVGLHEGVFVYFGGPALPTSPGWTLRDSISNEPTDFGFRQVLWAGDVNADGFSDLAIVVEHAVGPDTVQLYLGGASPSTTPAREIAGSTDAPASVLLAGDMNGDGFADLYQGDSFSSSAADVVSFGPDLGVSSDLSRSRRAATACDFNADGSTDLLDSGWCAWNVNGLGTASRVDLSEAYPTAGLSVTSSPLVANVGGCDGPLPAVWTGATRGNVQVADIGDTNGDGYGDLLVGDPGNDRAVLLLGGCPIRRVLELPDSVGLAGWRHTSFVAATGDLDGDGFPDFAVASVATGIDSLGPGEIDVYRGGPADDSPMTPSLVLKGAGGSYGFAVVSLD